MTLLKEAAIWWHNLTPKEKYMYAGNCTQYGLSRLEPHEINKIYYTHGIEIIPTDADYITKRAFVEFAEKNNHIKQHFVLCTHNKEVLDAYQRMINPDYTTEKESTIINHKN